MTNDELRAQAIAAVSDRRLRQLLALCWATDAQKAAERQARNAKATEPQPQRGKSHARD
ncbi:MAG: hypothetical protein PHO57_09905 [Acidithiobacillus sp.]|nr:hypothetical protein [Acidithiobacillus sp.]